MVQCQICGKSFKMLTNSHLQHRHGMTMERYMTLYPDAKLYDEEMHAKIRETRHRVDREECRRPGCDIRVKESHHKYCSRSCSMSHRMSKSGRNEQGDESNHRAKDLWTSLERKNKAKARHRDNYTCQECGKKAKGRGLHVHHIAPARFFDAPEKAHSLDNLLCLCPSCHQQVEWQTIETWYRKAVLYDRMMDEMFARSLQFAKEQGIDRDTHNEQLKEAARGFIQAGVPAHEETKDPQLN